MKRTLIVLAATLVALILAFGNALGNADAAYDSEQSATKTLPFFFGSTVLLRPDGYAYLMDRPNETTRVVAPTGGVGCQFIADSPYGGALVRGWVGPFEPSEQWLLVGVPPCPPPAPQPAAVPSSCFYDDDGNFRCPPVVTPSQCYYDSAGNYICPAPSAPATGPVPTSDRFTYRGDGHNVGGGTTFISAGSREMVVFTTGPVRYRHWFFPGQAGGFRRGSIVIFLGPVFSESVFMEFGGWRGTYVATFNVGDAWRSLVETKVWDMRHFGNCSDPVNGCQFLDILVVNSGGAQVHLENPRRTY